MEGDAAVAVVAEGVVGVAEIDVLDAAGRAVLDAVEVAEDAVDDAAAGMGDLASDAMHLIEAKPDTKP